MIELENFVYFVDKKPDIQRSHSLRAVPSNLVCLKPDLVPNLPGVCKKTTNTVESVCKKVQNCVATSANKQTTVIPEKNDVPTAKCLKPFNPVV